MSIFGNIAKAAFAVAAAPVAAVVDVVMIIPDSCSHDPKRDSMFSRTGAILGAAADKSKAAFDEAMK